MRNISSKSQGDILPSGDFNANLRSELQNTVQSADFTLDSEGGPDTNVNMLAQAIALYANAGWYYADSGSANAYTLTRVGNLKSVPAYKDGMIIVFIADNANTDASTINVDTLGSKSLTVIGGTDLVGGEIRTDQYIIARYHLSGDRFEIVYSGAITQGQVNLIINSGFGVCSDSTLENVGNLITLTDVTAGVCSTADTENLVEGMLFRFASGDFNGEVFEVTSVTVDTSFTIHDTSKTDTGSPGTGYEVTPGYVAADAAAPDGWGKDITVDLFREFNGTNTKDGSFFALKMVPSVQSDWVQAFQGLLGKDKFIKQFAGRTLTSGAWVKSSTANDIQLRINDGIDSILSSFHTGGGNYEWLEVTKTISDNPTQIQMRFMFQNATPGIAYASQPMLIFGHSIGEGNYIPQIEEVIYLEEANVNLNSLNNVTVSANININLEAETNGFVPKNIKAVRLFIQGDCATIEKFIGLGKTSVNDYDLRLISQVANNRMAGAGWIQTVAADGDMIVTRDDTWNNVRVRLLAVQLR